MVASLRRVIRERQWDEEDVQVWVDLASIPQNTPLLKQLAVQTIACYCAAAHAFIICAPTTVHADTGKVCDVASYQRRMWCRCEQLCHVMRKGTSSMWCATTVDDCKPLGELGREWLMAVLRVFEGDVTEEKDKLSIVLPILGLYAEMYAVDVKRGVPRSMLTRQDSISLKDALSELSPKRCTERSPKRVRHASLPGGLRPPSPERPARRSSTPGGGSIGGGCSLGATEAYDHTLKLVLSEIHRGRSEIFPPKLPMSAEAFAQLPLWQRLLSRLPTCLVGEAFDRRMDLFGELIQVAAS